MNKTITTTQYEINRFADLTEDVRRMVETRSDFRVSVMTTPRKLLAEYLRACEKFGLRPFNDLWLERAWAVVEEIETSRAAAWKQFTSKAAAKRNAATA